MKKKKILILTLFIIIIFILIYYLISHREKTLSEITGIEYNQIAYVTYGSAPMYDSDNGDEVIVNTYKISQEEYENAKFKKGSEKYGATSRSKYTFYDSSNNILFSIISMGSGHTYFICKGNRVKYLNKNAYTSYNW